MSDAVTMDEERPEIPANCPPPLKSLIQACWHTDPAARPHFKDIASALDNIVIDILLPVRGANEFWKRAFLKNTPNDVVRWEEFAPAFASAYKISVDLRDDKNEKVRAMKAILVPRPDQGPWVWIEGLAELAQYFGPLEKGDVLEKVYNIVSSGYSTY
eukprot:TRINITY_DN46212_c0_g1_i2.p1 TRINITY_DN46212_c0_g1~~TRINITY_DN46212_c0_g1_i2.p1  ORF type:complete len:176 (-),score=3.99 TRINITY_DN46212_c0_g1_i2:39-512(-)